MYRILFFLLLIPGISFTQEVEDKKSRFPLFELSKGDDNTKNINWGDYHYNNENYGKAVERYQKVTNPSVEIQRKMALAFIEIDSVDRALVMFETIVNAEMTSILKITLTYHNSRILQASTQKLIKIERNTQGRRLER